MSAQRKLKTASVDRKYQKNIGKMLGEVAAEYRKGNIDGLFIVIERPHGRGQRHLSTAISPVNVVWAANKMILDVMLVRD